TRRRLRMDQLTERQVAAVFVALLLFGGGIAVARLFGSKDAQKQIQINNSTVIIAGAEAMGISPEELQQTIEETIKRTDRGKLANEAIRVIGPARGATAGSFIVDGNPDLMIQPQTIEAIPTQVFPDSPEQYLQPFTNVELEIRATDLDSPKRGWGVVI